jgi:dephospho-CoA kinase
MTKRPMLIGIVGGIASGKSEVASLLVQHGAARINADELGHILLTSDESIQEKVVGLFGESILDESQQIDRKKIASQVFGNDSRSRTLLDQLEAILHPAIRHLADERLAMLRKQPGIEMIVLDAPLLIEAGWSSMCDEILFVDTPLGQRQQYASRRGWSVDELAKREATQLALTEKRSAASKVIVNDGDLDSLKRKVKAIIREWGF